MAVHHLSFREQIKGQIAVLLGDAGMTNCPATRDGMVTVIDSMSRYQEEGQRLFPKLILTEDKQTVSFLLPQSDYLLIGKGPVHAETYRVCLKKCAPLATDDWYILVERKPDEINYGLIRNGHSGLSALPEQILRELGTDTPNISTVIFRQIADGIVQSETSNGYSLSISYSDKEISDSDRRPMLSNLYNRITSHADPEVRPELTQLLDRIFAWAIERGHGTLAVVIETNKVDIPEGLKDGTWLLDPIDLTERVKSELGTNDGIPNTSTRSIINVIAGMLMSDGITVFDSGGRVRGYNAFAKPMAHAEMEIMTSNVGGARRRTFKLLCSWLGSLLTACLMVSQDGAILYQEVKD
ncbi:MAG TPA: hypothetical protein VKU00_08325 [Chthonomonadaceae bacterium]|nr:hypothetical protein [Chthonomonadaceae bacterium]